MWIKTPVREVSKDNKYVTGYSASILPVCKGAGNTTFRDCVASLIDCGYNEFQDQHTKQWKSLEFMRISQVWKNTYQA